MKKKLLIVFIMLLNFIFFTKTSFVKATTSETWQNYEYNNIDLYNKTNTFAYQKLTNDDGYVTQYYNMDSESSLENVTTGLPQLTVLTPGLGSTASTWSRNGNDFAYEEDSLITRLENITNAQIYWYIVENEGSSSTFTPTLRIVDISSQNEKIKNGTVSSNVYSRYLNSYDYENFRITDISRPIIIVFETTRPNESNNIVYEDFNFAISKAVYDIKCLNNGLLPKINLIGHSRGGLTNLQYSLDHPRLVSSMFSIGTPYLGSSTASFHTNLLKLVNGNYNDNTMTSPGENDIINSDIYLGYMNRWNNSYDSLYKDINVYAIGGYSDLDMIKSSILLAVNGEYNDLIEETFNTINFLIYGACENISETNNFSEYQNANENSNLLDNENSDETNIKTKKDLLIETCLLLLSFVNEFAYNQTNNSIHWYNDALVDLSSQLGYKEITNSQTNYYKGFNYKVKEFRDYNSEKEKKAADTIPVVHNLEPRDYEIISFILNKIQIYGKIEDDFETYDITSSTVGIKTYLKQTPLQSLIIPSTIDGKTVIEIGDYAFSGDFNTCDIINSNNNESSETVLPFRNGFSSASSIESILIPITIVRIGINAFNYCTNLQSVLFENEENSNLNLIDDYAFSNCKNLYTFDLPNTNIRFGEKIYLNSQHFRGENYNSLFYYEIENINCQTEKISKKLFVNKNKSIYANVYLECYARYTFFVSTKNFNSSNKIKIQLYDRYLELLFDETLTNVDLTEQKIIKNLEKGRYFLLIKFVNEEEGFVDFSIDSLSFRPEALSLNTSKNVLEHLHDNYNEFTFGTTKSDFYQFKLSGNSTSTYDRGSIIFYTMKKGEKCIIQKFNFNDIQYDNAAVSGNNGNSIIIFIEASKTYYIEINVNRECFTHLSLQVTELEQISLDENDNYDNSDVSIESDFIKILNINHTGNYNISFEYINTTNSNGIFIIMKKNSNNEFTIINKLLINNFNDFNENLELTENDNIYIGCFNTTESIINFSIIRNISSIFSLQVDPNANVTCGSEVRLNHGSYGKAEITQGYTRICYLGNDAPNRTSRTLYYWYSSDENVAIVSAYGTITATALWDDSVMSKTVTIRAVYKDDLTIVGEIELTVYKYLSDSNNEIVLTKYGMDVRDSGDQGTEVTKKNENAIPIDVLPDVTIHKGYTRLICLGDDSPTNMIQHFIWSTTNNEGETGEATVSQFGTITGKKAGYVTIKGVYKYNPIYVVNIRIQVI